MGSAEVMNVIGDVAGRTCIIQDDIIDTAGTIVKAANALKANGAARVIACAVHGVLSGPAIERLEAAPIEQVIITNTIPLHADRARACSKITPAVGGAPARAGDSEHQRGDVGFVAVRIGAISCQRSAVSRIGGLGTSEVWNNVGSQPGRLRAES